MRTSTQLRRRRAAKKNHQVRARLLVELLEDRNLLSNGLWLVDVQNLRGTTRQEQMDDAAQRLFAAGLSTTQAQVVDHVGVDGIVVVQTPLNVTQDEVNLELQDVRGFQYVEGYDPLAAPDQRISQFPTSPAAEQALDEQIDVNGEPVSRSLGSAPGNTGGTSGPSIVQGVAGFAGIDTTGSNCGCSPPDSTGAAGPSSYIEPVNTSLRIYQKDGTPVTAITSFGTFFSSLGGELSFSDPVIVYNDITQRFFIGMLDYDTSSNSRLDVAISKSNNPTDLTSANWNFHRYNLNDSTSQFDFADYPKIGYDADGYVISTNQFVNASSYDHVAVLAINNDGTLPSGVTHSLAVPGGFLNFTMAPARMHDNPGGSMWFVETPGSASNSQGDQITVVRMDNVFTSSPSFTFTPLTVNSYLSQPSPLGGSRTGLGTRMYFSAFRTVGGVTHLVAANSPGVSDPSGTRTHVRWYDITIDYSTPTLPSPSLSQEGEINPGPGIDTYFPDADIAPDGTIGLDYSQSIGSGISDPRAGYMDMYVTGRRPGDAPGTMETPIVAVLGQAPLNAFDRAGDYSFTTVDPTDGTFWAANEFSSNASSPNWATWIQHFKLGFAVTSTTPAVGAIVSTPPTSFVINFSDLADPASVLPRDLTVNKIMADGVSLSSDDLTATFTFATSPVTAEGLQTMAIPAGFITTHNGASGIAAFNGTFRYDDMPLTVASTTPAAGSTITLNGTSIQYVVNFSDDNTDGSIAGVATSNLTLSAGTVTNATQTGPDQATYTIGGLTAEGPLQVSIAAGALTDAFGNPCQAFSASYTLNFGVVPYPLPLQLVAPAGSLVYRGSSAVGTINPATDTDTFTLPVNPGQTLTVLVTPTSAGLQPSVTLLDPSSATAGMATAAAAGQDALLQTAAATLGGTYQIVVSGANSTTGGYSVQVTLNAALEAEGLIAGASDNTLATAQDISGSFVTVQPSATSATRGAVLGVTDPNAYGAAAATTTFQDISKKGKKVLAGVDDGTFTASLPFAFPFYSATYTSVSFSSNGLITFGGADPTPTNSDLRMAPAEAAIAVFWDDLVVKGNGTSAVYYQTVGSGASQKFVIDWNNVSFKADSSYKGGLTFEAVLGADGSIQLNYKSLSTGRNGGAHDLGKHATVGIKDAGTQPNPLVLMDDKGPTTLINSNKSVLISLGSATPDIYSFTLNGGDKTTLAVKALSAGTLNVDLLNSAGSVVASGLGSATNLDKVISNVPIVTGGTYYARVTGSGGTNYSLIVTDNAAFDTEPNGTFTTAQDITGVLGVLGFVGNIPPIETFDAGPSELNLYTFLSTNNASVTAAAAHDGPYGLQLGNPTEWMYRNDSTVHVQQGETISVWVNWGATPGSGRAYFGFGATSTGTLSMVMGGNTGTLIIQNNAGYQFTDIGSVSQTWLANHWYRFEVNWQVGDAITGKLYDSNGTTLLNTVTATDNSITAGGIAFRGFGSTYFFDSVTPSAGVPSEDWYTVTVSSGSLTIQTSTPSDGPGVFGNTLNPHIELYNLSDVLVTSGTKLGDGRNEIIDMFPVTAGATYWIRIMATHGTSGEYFLDPPPQAAPAADGGAPAAAADGAAATTGVGQVTVDWSMVGAPAATSSEGPSLVPAPAVTGREPSSPERVPALPGNAPQNAASAGPGILLFGAVPVEMVDSVFADYGERLGEEAAELLGAV